MPEEKPLLMLLDGNALVHRAFHALPPLTVSKSGEMVNAVYGFASMLLKTLREFKPTHYAIAFDLPAPTFRHQLFEEYKAQRPPTPKELTGQFHRVKQLVEAFHIPVFEVEGYEADDVLGTLSRQAAQKGIETIIVTGDADAMQLVAPTVKVLTPGKTFSDTRLYDEEAVQEKYSLSPSAIADLKALEGDTSDNIPGVPGIGAVNAARLIKQFGSLEGIYAHLEEVTPEKIRESLRTNKEQALQSKKLATIVRDVPLELDLEKCRASAYEREKAAELFRELEFVKLLSQLPPSAPGQEPTTFTVQKEESPHQRKYSMVTTEEALAELLTRLAAAPFFVVDVETSSLSPIEAGLVGISLSWQPGEAYYIPLGHRGLEQSPQLPLPLVVEKLAPLLQDPSRPKIAHNGNFDLLVLAQQGMEVKNLTFDTMIAAHLLNEKALGLKALAFSKLGIEMTPISDLIGSGAKQLSMADVEASRVAEYACADADITLRLSTLFEAQLRETGLWNLFAEVEMPLVPVLVHMENNGVALDKELLGRLSQELGKQMREQELAIYNAVGHMFNINSTQQLAGVLYDELRLPHSRKTKSGYSTEASVLEELRRLHPVVENILQYRQLTKLKSTYVDALPALINRRTGRVHTQFNQTGTATGRLSSSDPNLQNVPIRTDWGKKIRQAFIAPPPALLLGADYSQIDLRVLAHFSQDPRLLTAFRQDEDIHAATASEVFGVPLSSVNPEMRRVAKTVNFGVIYGMSGYGLEQATELSREKAAHFIQAYFERYPGVKSYLELTREQARSRGYVETLLGRRRYIPEVNSPNRQVREAAERMAINMPVQGTSADIIKIAMVNLYREMEKRKLRSKMLLQVHDELVFEVPPEEMEEMKSLAVEKMSQARALSVPLKVEVKMGRNWGEME